MRAKLYFHNKHVYTDGAIIEMKVWRVPKIAATPEGYKYSLVYITKEGNRILGYDNAEGQGHHCHRGKNVEKIRFKSVKNLMEKFIEEVMKIRRTIE